MKGLRMRTNAILYFTAIAAATLSLSACMKDTEDTAQDLGILPSTCGSAGARLQASVDGASYCASAQLIATGDSSTVMVTGVDLSGSSLLLQVDTLAQGTFEINEMNNAIVYMQVGNTFVVDPAHPGTLTITAFNASTQELKAVFNVTLLNELNGQTRALNGDFDVIYTISE